MSSNSPLNHIGEQMAGALNDALNTGNFDNLKSLVADTVTYAISEAGAATSKVWQQSQAAQKTEQSFRTQAAQSQAARNEEMRRFQQQRQEQLKQRNAELEQQRQEQLKQRSAALEQQRQEQLRRRNEMLEQQRIRRTGLVVDVKKNGFTAGVLFIVFGALANVPLFIFSLIGLVRGWSAAGYLLLSLLVSILFICHGKDKILLIDQAKRYVKLCGTKMYAEVEELASQVGMSKKKVEKELRKILRKGIIPSARMDKKGTHLMLNEEVYKQYMEAEKSRTLRELEEKEKKSGGRTKLLREPAAEEKNAQQTELEQMVAEGQSCIEKLRHMNDLIPGEVISLKLDRLEGLLTEIFARVQKEPAQMNRMHRVMNYYLPTTLKLVEAYHEFDIVKDPGEEILTAKKDIEGTLDTINEAFVELLNNLFMDRVFDVTTDAQVLQTMLASDGLTKDMELNKERI